MLDVVSCLLGFALIISGLYLMSTVKIKKYTVNDCPEEIKQKILESNPGLLMIKEYGDSLEKFEKEMKDFAFFLKDVSSVNYDKHKSQLALSLCILTNSKVLLESSWAHLNKVRLRKANRYVRKYGRNSAVNKLFGTYIEDFYFTKFLMDALKELLNGDTDEVLSKEEVDRCKQQAIEIRGQYA